MKNILYTIILSFLFSSSVFGVSNIVCPVGDNVVWDNCVGKFTHSNGDEYIGEWKNNKANGKGFYIWLDGTINEGIWADGELINEVKLPENIFVDSKEPEAPASSVGDTQNNTNKIVEEIKEARNDRNVKRVIIKADPFGMYIIMGKINGSPVQFLVDTGASLVAMNSKLAARSGIKYKNGIQIQIETAMGTDIAYQIPIKEIKVGDIELHNVMGGVSDKMMATALLGMSFLGELTIKQKGRVMILEQEY